MYGVYAILKVEDRYDYASPEVSVMETSNYEGELIMITLVTKISSKFNVSFDFS